MINVINDWPAADGLHPSFPTHLSPILVITVRSRMPDWPGTSFADPRHIALSDTPQEAIVLPAAGPLEAAYHGLGYRTSEDAELSLVGGSRATPSPSLASPSLSTRASLARLPPRLSARFQLLRSRTLPDPTRPPTPITSDLLPFPDISASPASLRHGAPPPPLSPCRCWPTPAATRQLPSALSLSLRPSLAFPLRASCL